MSQPFLFEEDDRWPAKIIRVVIWSGTMGVLWVLPFIAFVFVTACYLNFMEAQRLYIPQEYKGLGLGLIFYGVLGGCREFYRRVSRWI